MHLRVALVFGVLRRGRGSNQRSIHNRALAQDQTLLAQVLADQRKDARGHVVTLQQTAKLQQRRRVRRLSFDQINAHKAAYRNAVDDRVLDPFIRQPQAVLAQVHAQHQFQPDRRTTPLAKVVMRLDQRDQDRPRHQTIQVSQKFLPTRRLLTRRVLHVGEAGLLFHRGGRETRDDLSILWRHG
jgi:hypothetical protein